MLRCEPAAVKLANPQIAQITQILRRLAALQQVAWALAACGFCLARAAGAASEKKPKTSTAGYQGPRYSLRGGLGPRQPVDMDIARDRAHVQKEPALSCFAYNFVLMSASFEGQRPVGRDAS
jgi:hypothetical protein